MLDAEPVAVKGLERGGKERSWDENVSRFGGKAKVEEVLACKVPPRVERGGACMARRDRKAKRGSLTRRGGAIGGARRGAGAGKTAC